MGFLCLPGIATRSSPATFNVHKLLLGTLHDLCGTKIRANHKYLDLAAEVSPKQLVSFFTATRLRQLVEKDYFIAILVKNEQEKIEACVQIKPLQAPTASQEKVATVSAPLYPSLALPSLN